MKDLFIFTSAGSDLSAYYKHKVFYSWGVKNFDSGCVVFNKNTDFNYDRYFNKVLYNQNFKFPNLFFYIKNVTNLCDKYKYIIVIDDDLLLNQNNTFTKLIKVLQKYKLGICSIGNSTDIKKSSHDIMNTTSLINELWITNFCEMGFMCIRSDLLSKIIKYYYNSGLDKICKDFGMDFFVCNYAINNSYNIGIIKNMTYTNPFRKRVVEIIQMNKIKYLTNIRPKIIKKYDI